MPKKYKPPLVTYEVLLRVTDDGEEGYLSRAELRKLILAGQGDCAGIKFKIHGIQELPPRDADSYVNY